MATKDLEAELDRLEAEFYQSAVNKDLKNIEPYLDQIEMILPDQPINPIMQFRVLVKASGSDLPCDGSWFQISVADQDLPIATIISQPQGDSISFGMTGEWYVELPAPLEMGDYWLQATMGSIETDRRIVKTPFAVLLNSESELHPSFKKRVLFSITFLSSVFGIIWLIFSSQLNTTNQDQSKKTSTISPKTAQVSKKGKEITTNQILDSKTKIFIDKMLEQSFNDLSVTTRQKAWQKLSQFIDLQTDADNTLVREIRKRRADHKHQMEEWLISNENLQESLKRIQVLAFIDDDEHAQRRLGNYYAFGKNVVKNLGKAWQWYQRAASKGDIKSQQLLTALEAQADQLLKSPSLNDRIQAYQVTEAAASAGGINAQLWMGYRYESGDGISQNLLIAADWYRQAAEQGSSIASKKLKKILDLISKHKNEL